VFVKRVLRRKGEYHLERMVSCILSVTKTRTMGYKANAMIILGTGYAAAGGAEVKKQSIAFRV
jgi:hypothetical protein